MGRQEPLHPPAKIAIRVRPQNQVEVVRHEAIRQHPHRYPFARERKQINKGLIITLRMEDVLPRIAAIDDVVTDASDRGSSRPWHGSILPGQTVYGKKKVECPLFLC